MAEAIETAIDRMVDLVQSHGTMSVSQMAKELRIGETQVEEIANVLAESGMIRIRYSLTGTFIEPKEAVLKPKEREKGVAEAKKRAGIRSLLSQVESEISESEGMLKSVEDEVLRRMKRVETLLDEIKAGERGANDDELRILRAEATELERNMGRFSTGMEGVEAEVRRLTERIHSLEAKPQERAQVQGKPGLFGRLFGIFGRRKGG